MITVTVSKSGTGMYKSFVCSGHAGYAKAGSDIVCAAVSMLVINTVNAVEKLTDQNFTCESSEADGTIRFAITSKEPSGEAQLLLAAMVLGLKEVEKQYPKKYVKLKIKEV